jgi:hypothetical protein
MIRLFFWSYSRFLVPFVMVGLLLSAIPLQAVGVPTNAVDQTVTIPPGTAIPVIFSHTIDASKAKSGKRITAITMQIVLLPDGRTIPARTTLIGHVVQSRPFAFNPSSYAVQTPSILSIHFDKIVEKDLRIPVSLSVRALSNFNTSDDAHVYHYLTEQDGIGKRVLVGGSWFKGRDEQVRSPGGDVVAYNRKQGIFGRLIASDNANLHCENTETEQSLAIFSPDACGIYGFQRIYLLENGHNTGGAFTLQSDYVTVRVRARSTALLQVEP